MRPFKNRILYLPLLILFAVISLGNGKAAARCGNTGSTVNHKADSLLGLMTLDEKLTLFAGKNYWNLNGVARLGIPSIKLTDGGHGVTVKDNGCSVCYPTAIGQAATWDRELIYKVGAALGRDTRQNQSSILLGPMVNIHRVPVGGRNYETYSEDPFLAGELAAALINGIQSEDIGAVIKSFAANNQQQNQEGLLAEVSERALHEIYFPPFRIALAKSRPVGVMTAYNGLNGVPTSESEYLLKEVLKESWQYNGFIISDWRAVVSGNSIPAGLDIEMPGPGKFMNAKHMRQAVKEGRISEDEIDERVARYLRALYRMGIMDTSEPNREPYSAAENALIAQAAAEGSIVLLKNKNNLLPLDKGKIRTLAILGPNAQEARLGGGGSSSVTVCGSVSPLTGIEDYLAEENVKISFMEGAGLKDNLPIISKEYLTAKDENGKTVNGLKGEYFSGVKLAGEAGNTRYDEKIDFSWGWAAPLDNVHRSQYSVRWTGQLHAPVTGEYKLGTSFSDSGVRLYVDGQLVIDEWGDPDNEITEAKFLNKSRYIELFMEQGSSHDICLEFHRKQRMNSVRLEWQLPGSAPSIDEAVELARKSDAAIIFAGLSNVFEGGTNDRKDLVLPGEQNKLIEAVAKANSNTIVVLFNGTPLQMPWIKDVNSVLEAFYPGQEGGRAIARILFGEVNPSGKLPDTFPVKLEDNRAMENYPGENHVVNYAEGIYIGYRQFEKDRIKPLFPFGYGLSYTTFKFANLFVDGSDADRVELSFELTNTGKHKGSEVAQVYIRDVRSSADRPVKELKGFEKIELNPGETKKVVIELDRYAFSFYDERQREWVLEPGEFEIQVGSSSQDIHLKKTIFLK